MPNQATIELVKHFEGCRLKAYQDAVGIPTIGYGETRGVRMGMEWTQEQAEQALTSRLSEFERGVVSLVKVPLGANQLGALTCFAYNVGLTALSKSTLLKKLNGGDYAAIPAELMRWNKAGGRVLAGLTRRRSAEGALWVTP